MDPKERLDETMRGYQSSIVLLTAGKTGIFTALGHSTRTAAELAAELKLDPRAVETLLLALTADSFLELSGDCFRIAEVYTPFLLPDSSQTLASILNHNFTCMRRWSNLSEVVQSGQPTPRETPRYEGPELRDFICGMANISRLSSLEVAEKFDLSPYRHMLDLGGGPGTSSIVFAQRYPALHCVVFDLPEAVAISTAEIDASGLANRITTRAGDFFEDDLGDDYDLVYVSNIIHSLGPEEITRVMAKVHAALAPGGSVVVKDFFLDDTRTDPAFAALFSINMLVATDRGKSYTWSEARQILNESGFGDFRSIPVVRASSLLVAQKQ